MWARGSKRREAVPVLEEWLEELDKLEGKERTDAKETHTKVRTTWEKITGKNWSERNAPAAKGLDSVLTGDGKDELGDDILGIVEDEAEE